MHPLYKKLIKHTIALKIFLLFFAFTLNNINSQEDSSKVKAMFIAGFSFNFEDHLFIKDLEGDTRLNLSLFDLRVGYNFTNNCSIGLTFGNNLFTLPQKFKAGFQYSPLIQPPETTFYYIDGYYLKSLTWLGVYFEYEYKKHWNVSLSLAYLHNEINYFNKYIAFSTGYRFYFNTLFLGFELAYSFIFRDLNNLMNSKQLTIKSIIGLKL